MEAEKKAPAVSDVGAWAMNVVSSVSLIMANKQLMSSSGYAFAFGNPPSSPLLSSRPRLPSPPRGSGTRIRRPLAGGIRRGSGGVV
jgi:hypothetical protein